MSQPNLPNGIPPFYPNPSGSEKPRMPPHLNGVDSSHSSRSGSPSLPQLPSKDRIPASQLPPSVSTLTQGVKQMQVTPNASPKVPPPYSTSTPISHAPYVYSPASTNSASGQFTNVPLMSAGNTNGLNTMMNNQNYAYGSQNFSTSTSSVNQNNVPQQPYPGVGASRAGFPVMGSVPPVQGSHPPVSSVSFSAHPVNRAPITTNTTNNQIPMARYPPISQPTATSRTSLPPTSTTYPHRTGLQANRYPQPVPTNLPLQPSMTTGYQQPFQQPPPYPNGQQQANFQQVFDNTQQMYQNQSLQDPYGNQMNVARTGFNKLWGQDCVDLLAVPNILPQKKVEPTKPSLGQAYLDATNCSTEVFRTTLTKVPETSNLLQKSRLPLGILIHPFKDLNHLPVIQCNVIVRCRACRTYINPFVFFVDHKRWKCNLCYRVNELPEEFQYDPVSKTYGDPSRRPEVKASTIEYIAPAEYMLRPPQPAVYLFLLDVSRPAVESGYLHVVCNVLMSELTNLPGDSRTQVGFLAYDSALHFFYMGDGVSQPHEMVVLDLDEVFLPTPDNLLVNLKDRFDLVTDLLTQLPTKYSNSFDGKSALGAALQVAHKLIFSTGGRVTVFQASLPNIGPGALTAREDPLQRQSAETHQLNPANDFYKRLSLECSGQQIAVDLFIVNSQYVDMATISGISRFSGGCIHHFPLFSATRPLQSTALERTFRRYLTRKIGFEAVMRVRCTRGMSIHSFHGNFFVRSTDLLSLPNVNPDAGFGMQISIDESLSDVQTVCFQAALLYTSSKGERRIRVHTLCLPVTSNLTDVINSADQQSIVGLLAKMASDRSMLHSLSDAREALVNAAIDILSSYKLSTNSSGPSSGLQLPHNLTLLPLYISALLKCTAFRIGTATRLDDRVKAMCDMKTKPLPQLMQMVYPDLYPVHNLEQYPTVLNEEEVPVPQPPHLQLSARSLDGNGAYLLDTGDHMYILVRPGVNSEFLTQGLGVGRYESIPDDMYEVPILENPCNRRLNCFINYLNDEKPFIATLHVIREDSAFRGAVYERFIEDRIENALSYHEFLQHLKTQVK